MKDCKILHCDANNFYASVEIRKNPELKGKCVAVCGDPERRHGIVLAKSYEAKKFNVKTGDTVWQAKQKCPDLITLPPDFAEYTKFSNNLFQLYTCYTDKVECFGMDECWLDVNGSERLFGDSLQIAEKIRTEVKNALGITVSIGVSFTKIFAKLGSDYKKPDAITLISPDNYKSIAWSLPVEDLLMVGASAKKTLYSMGIRTIGELACYNEKVLEMRLGVQGKYLHQYANGEEPDKVKKYYEKSVPESIGNGSTSTVDMQFRDECAALISALSESVATRLRQHGLWANGVHLTLKNNKLESAGKQVKLSFPIASATDLIDTALKLLDVLWNEKDEQPLRAITVTAINLIGKTDYYQSSLMPEELMVKKNEELEKSVDKLRKKYGYEVITRGIILSNSFVSDKLLSELEFRPFKKN